MAIYVPTSTRRRNTIIVAVAAVVVGLALGLLGGRASAPSVADRVASVQERARTATSQLRVVALHEDAGTGSGTSLALTRARDDLVRALDDAPWIPKAERAHLLAEVDQLRRRADGAAIERVAKDIDAAFGLTG